MAKIGLEKYKYLTYEEMGKKVAEEVLDGYIYQGKTLREWIDVLAQTQWIPVETALPDKNIRCLVAVGRFNYTQIATFSDLMGTIDHRIFYQGEYGHEDFMDITQYVKAWQRLPEPYKQEVEE